MPSLRMRKIMALEIEGPRMVVEDLVIWVRPACSLSRGRHASARTPEPGPFNLSRHRRSPLLGSHGRPNWRSTTWVTPKLTAIDISEIASDSDSPFAAIKKCLISRNASRVAPSSEDLAKISVCALSPSSARQLGKLKPAAPLHARLAGGGAPADGRAEARGFVGSRRAAERGTVAGRPRLFEPSPLCQASLHRS